MTNYKAKERVDGPGQNKRGRKSTVESFWNSIEKKDNQCPLMFAYNIQLPSSFFGFYLIYRSVCMAFEDSDTVFINYFIRGL
jgi:hypothetical protein